MRKNLLALSIAAMVGGLSGVANAQVQLNTGTTGGVNLISFDPVADVTLIAARKEQAGKLPITPANPTGAANELKQAKNGVGHILVVPYFSAQNGNMSLLSITNTDQLNAKAVKLRYRGAANSDDLFDITVYLSPGDVWSANVSKNADGYAYLETTDNSCTLPSKEDIKSADMKNGQFKTNRLDGGVVTPQPQGTLEGYIEILNTADIPPAVTLGRTSLYERIKHIAGKAACGLGDQVAPLTKASPNTPVERGYGAPSGGLMANWMIVNAVGKATYSGEAVALGAVAYDAGDLTATPPVPPKQVQALGRLVWAPQSSEYVSYAAASTLTADPLLLAATDTAPRPALYDFPDLSTPYTTATANPVDQAIDLASTFATTSIVNEYSAAGAFNTDWVFTMPTRRYVVAVDYAADAIVPGFETSGASSNLEKYKHFYYGKGGNVSYDRAKKRICVDAGSMTSYDREETIRTQFVISPDATLRFCGEASVLSFNVDKSKVLGADIAAQQVNTKMNEGWLRIETQGRGKGLPVIGYSVIKMDGVNLGGTWAHSNNLVKGNY